MGVARPWSRRGSVKVALPCPFSGLHLFSSSFINTQLSLLLCSLSQTRSGTLSLISLNHTLIQSPGDHTHLLAFASRLALCKQQTNKPHSFRGPFEGLKPLKQPTSQISQDVRNSQDSLRPRPCWLRPRCPRRRLSGPETRWLG